MLRLLSWTLLAGGAVFSAPARSQELIAIDILDGVFSVDPRTSNSSLIGFTGLNQYLWHSMAKNSSGQIYSAYGTYFMPYAIYEIDPQTGQATFVAQTDLNAIFGMAFGPGDVLYAIQDTTAPTTCGPDDLYRIDLQTGITTRIGGTGFLGLQALAYGQGSLWSWDGCNDGLVRIDPVTGLGVDVNPSIQDNGGNICHTLAFSDAGVLFGASDGLYIVDTISGALSFVGVLHGIWAGGMEFLPNQPEPFSLGVIGETGGPMGVRSAGATPGGQVAVMMTTGGGSSSRVPSGTRCAGTIINLNSNLTLVKLARADAQGRLILGPIHVPPAAAGHYRLQALDLATCRTSNVARTVF
jgi:hypothetical protein